MSIGGEPLRLVATEADIGGSERVTGFD